MMHIKLMQYLLKKKSAAKLQRKTLISAAFIAMWRGDMRDVIKYMRIKSFSFSFGKAEMGKVK
jgi:hypothetical protein